VAVWTAKQGIKFFFSGMESKVFEVCPLSIFFPQYLFPNFRDDQGDNGVFTLSTTYVCY